MIFVFMFLIMTCWALPLTSSLDVYFDGRWTVTDPLKSTYSTPVEIHNVVGADYYVVKLLRPANCFYRSYKVYFSPTHVNITSLSNHMVSTIHFVNFKNTLFAKSTFFSCGEWVEYTLTILRSTTPSLSISYINSSNSTRTILYGWKVSNTPPNETLLQTHFLSILAAILVGLLSSNNWFKNANSNNILLNIS
ncbi:Uncharacterized protein QTN25_001573 [Entamoeba marina]